MCVRSAAERCESCSKRKVLIHEIPQADSHLYRVACAIAVCLYPPWNAQWYQPIRAEQREQLVRSVGRAREYIPSQYTTPAVAEILHGELRQLVIPQHAFRRGWLFSGPRQRSHVERDLRGALDWSRLALEEAVVILATALLLFMLKGR